jgi:Tol biopolymer transport system component
MDRSGRESGVVWDEAGLIISFALSRDASTLVVSRSQSNGRQNLWVRDLVRGSTARLTFEEADHYDPRWSPDNGHVIFDSTRDPARSPFKVSLPASEPAQVFKFDGMMFSLHDWSPDGRYLLYSDSNKPELWVRPLSGDQKPVLVARPMSGYVDQAQFSPDGRWIAFHANDSGRFEVNVIPFPPTGDKWQISTAGGGQPTWRRDGRELYFLALDATLMAVDIRPAAKFEWGEPRPLFKTPLSVGYDVEQYAPAPDGKRFLFQVPNLQGSKVPFAVILNWTSLLKK